MTKPDAEKFDPSNNVDLGDNPVDAKKAYGVALLEKYGLSAAIGQISVRIRAQIARFRIL